MRRFVSLTLGTVSTLAIVLCSSGARADPSEVELSKRLADLERDTAHRSALVQPLEKAKRALERSTRGAKGASWAPPAPVTDRHAALLRSVASEWLDVARDLVRTLEAERAASDAQKALDEFETKIVRGKALLEETVARRGRTQAELEALDKPKTERAPAPTATPVEKTPAPSAPAPTAPTK